MKKRKVNKITPNQIANHFYDEDYGWFKKNLGIKATNQYELEGLLEKSKKKRSRR